VLKALTLDTRIQPKRYAALCIFGRKATKRGDAVIDALPFAVDEVKRRGETRGTLAPRVFGISAAFLKAPVDASRTHDEVITALRERIDSHAGALHGLREEVRVVLAVFDNNVACRWRLRLKSETIDWLARMDASLMVDTQCVAPPGTDTGALCAFCGISRPLTDDDAFIRLLRWTSPNLGMTDACLVARSLDARATKVIAKNNRWFLFQPRDGLTVLVKALRQIDEYRGGGVAVSNLLRELRANRPVRRALLKGPPRSIDIHVEHWANAGSARAFLTRSDVLRMAGFRAALSYELVPDLKPQFSEHGECVHCDYVQPWNPPTNSDR
jgi:hypothetical protein